MTAIAEPGTFSTVDKKRKLIARLARVEGQLRGVQRLIDSEEDCGLIAQQLAAARGALNKAFFELIACAFESRLAPRSGAGAQREISEVSSILTKYA